VASPYTILVIPARGGSKRIPSKNVLPLAGRPLLAHSLQHARSARTVSEIWVSTDDPSIAQLADSEGARIVPRPAALADDRATSEAALVHALDYRVSLGLADPDLVVFLQATSPVRRADDIDRAVAQLLAEGADSLFSATENNRLIWAIRDGRPESINYNWHSRQREQDMTRQYRENGSIYVFKPSILRETGNRLGGRIAVYEMDYWSSFQVDTPEHVELCEWILRRPEFASSAAWPSRLDLVIFDFDGVMTDNGVWVSESGSEMARCDRGDGWGLGRLVEAGVRTMVISTERRSIAAARCEKLGIPCHYGVADKGSLVRRLLVDERLDPPHVAYVGNDVNDLPAMTAIGFPVAVADAHPDVLKIASLVLTRRGGHGAVREFCDLMLARIRAVSAPAP
jgi:YrbI family 3-deoxy-D-manno-octulosonate 8-phosphate phosphatase